MASSDTSPSMSPSELNDCSAAGLDHCCTSDETGDSKVFQEARLRTKTDNIATVDIILLSILNNARM